MADAEVVRVQTVLMAIVSEKTGYPAEMLEPAMQLDADLGIDSIKRVEILSALQEQLPDAPVIKPEHLGTLQTLGQIVEFLAARAATVEPLAQPAAATTTTTATTATIAIAIATASASAIAAVQESLLSIVSEKTGYPAEMLEPAMQLDADLGIDSIKRVEILSALQERLPDAPVVKPEHLGTLRTLGQIVEFLAAGAATVEPVAPAAATVTTTATATASASAAVQETLLAIVSEKPGYPAEMLEPAMQLDADLGIDSIKRVEILSALQEQLPDAPVIKPEHLGTLQTLGQIVEFLAAGVGPAAAPTRSAPPQGFEAEPQLPLQRWIPSCVPLDEQTPRATVRLRAGRRRLGRRGRRWAGPTPWSTACGCGGTAPGWCVATR